MIRHLALPAALLFAGCGKPASTLVPDNGPIPFAPVAFPPPIVDLRADTNRNGTVDMDDPTEDLNEDTWDATHGAIFLANIDDDLKACSDRDFDAGVGILGDLELALCNDAADDVLNGGDDLLDMAQLKTAPWPGAPSDATGTIHISMPGAGYVRLFRHIPTDYVLFDPATTTLTAADLQSGIELYLEGKDIVRDSAVWDGFIDVTFSVDALGNDVHPAIHVTDTVRMRISPVMTFHHLLPSETSYVVHLAGDPWSDPFVASLSAALTTTAENAPLVQLSNSDQDIWAQDFFETGYMSMPAAGGTQHVIRVNYRASNVFGTGKYPLREAGSVVFTKFRGPDVAGVQAFDVNHDQNSDSLNSYGNLETIPPYTSDAGTFPLGRMIRGSIPTFAPDPVMATLLESQGQQPHVYVDTSWLLVGHIDETVSFLKASTPRGWVMLVNDPTMARQMLLDAQDAGFGDTQMFIGKSWYDDNGVASPATVSINDTLNDTDVMMVSATAAVAIDAEVAVIKAATGITDAEIVHIPFLDHTEYGAAIAYQVGTVNAFVVGLHDIVVPSTFGPIINGTDIFKAQYEGQLALYGYTVHWIDDWDLYHAAEGEIHCGTNTARKIPDVKWWETGR